MRIFKSAVCVAVVVVAVAVFRGDNWQRVAVGVLFGLLVAAMLETASWKDWLFPGDDEPENEK